MRKTIGPFAIALLLVAAGCKNQNASTTSATDTSATTVAQSSSPSSTTSLSPEQLGALGAQIKKQPNDADKLLAAQGLTEESFAAAVRKVSESPADAKRYATAYKSAS
jgi:hypothetical protein